MNARFSHANCSHANTKVARNKCRRDLAKARNIIIAAADALINGPKMLTAAPAVSTDTIIETITIAEEITRENWREFKGQTVSVDLIGETVEGEITGWSAKNVQIKTDGKTVRHPVSIVIRATV